MKMRTGFLALGLTLGLAAPALAAPKTNLVVTNNTIAGPGTASVATGGSERIFSHATGGSDICVTVANTGKVGIGILITGLDSGSTSVPAGGSKAVCSDDTTAIDLTCMEEVACSAQWRVDDN